MAKEQPRPTDPGEDDDQGSWHLRSGGAWVFALALWLAGVGGVAVFARDGAEVAMARWWGIPGTVTIDTCAHTKNYALCYGPFQASSGSIRIKRLELRTLHHDQPGRHEKTWLRSRSATHAWASDVNPWTQLVPVLPFALLALVQTVWLGLSLRAWQRRRRPAPALAQPPPDASPVPPPASAAFSSESAPTAAYPLVSPSVPYAPPPATGYQSATGRAQPPGGAERPAPGVYRSRPPDVEFTQPPARRPPATAPPARRPPATAPPDRRGSWPGDQPVDQPGADDWRWARWQDRQGPEAPPGQFAPPAPPLRDRRPYPERPEDA